MNQGDRFVRAVNRFDKACQEYAFKGAQLPELHEKIEKEYADAKKHLISLYHNKDY